MCLENPLYNIVYSFCVFVYNIAAIHIETRHNKYPTIAISEQIIPFEWMDNVKGHDDAVLLSH